MERKTIWEQLVDQKEEWIGGTLTEYADTMNILFINYIHFGCTPIIKTVIKDIVFQENGDFGDLRWFEIVGEDFSCGFDTSVAGISGESGHDLRFGGQFTNFGIDKPKIAVSKGE